MSLKIVKKLIDIKKENQFIKGNAGIHKQSYFFFCVQKIVLEERDGFYFSKNCQFKWVENLLEEFNKEDIPKKLIELKKKLRKTQTKKLLDFQVFKKKLLEEYLEIELIKQNQQEIQGKMKVICEDNDRSKKITKLDNKKQGKELAAFLNALNIESKYT